MTGRLVRHGVLTIIAAYVFMCIDAWIAPILAATHARLASIIILVIACSIYEIRVLADGVAVFAASLLLVRHLLRACLPCVRTRSRLRFIYKNKVKKFTSASIHEL